MCLWEGDRIGFKSHLSYLPAAMILNNLIVQSHSFPICKMKAIDLTGIL